ncbi:Adenine nucleotide alpha hydrolases-like superfamily protein, putative isoform 1 [Theobroma cacao]|uniref:tRNA(Ile)-lysidine synthetase n=1 Tax=Theobroma cacao TaxID=3641 RepID=A0A061GN14_THECC|nr:Adenine nucleotide alpha hydrolases-like superfamily protein, putative isoform 1 [Theobroma cacao]
MARGLLLCSQTRTIAKLSFSLPNRKFRFKPHYHHLYYEHQNLPSTRVFCHCVSSQPSTVVDMAKYNEAFSRRMAMAGLKPHNHIALGVSGGPDSISLCVLAANWKTEGLYGSDKSGNYIAGLLAIIVDHGLRPESKDEASLVGHRVAEIGIRFEIARCDWSNGKPKQGQLQEAARDMRYKIFQDVCMQNQISVLLVAHHADDQAELFVLRSSRDSGVLGLAGMAFTSQVFSSHTYFSNKDWKCHSILLVRPLLDFSKEDMYKICQGSNHDWVEDPTNRSSLFARNRIRMSLGNLSSCIFKSELQAVISACRKTRTYVDQICNNLINQTVTIMEQGYAVIDLEALDPSKIEDICLSKFIALVLQYISQRQRPIRGSTSKLLLQYIRTIPCKTSLTAAGCYICPAPGSKGTKALICCSVHGPLPSKAELFQAHSSEEQKHCFSNELEQIIANGKSYSINLVPNASKVQFLNMGSASVLDEAQRLDIISESTYRNFILLQKEEVKRFKSKTDELVSECKSKQEAEHVAAFLSEPLLHGQTCFFMNRFIISWKVSKEISWNVFPREAYCLSYLGRESQHSHCCCINRHDMVAKIRPMIDADWLYLAELLKWPSSDNFEATKLPFSIEANPLTKKTKICSDYSRLSAKGALKSLKSVPAAARRSIPVLVNHDGQLLGIPSIGFNHCPFLMTSAVFKPRVPLGGGHSSFL